MLYASGEESTQQTSERARRLELSAPQLRLVSDSSLESILALCQEQRAALLLIDSIQTMRTDAAESSPGSAQQLRECTAALVRFAKQTGTAVIIVGHVTKDGAIAGPKLLEHLVDTVLYFDSDAGSRYGCCAPPRTASGRSMSWDSLPCPARACARCVTLRRSSCREVRNRCPEVWSWSRAMAGARS